MNAHHRRPARKWISLAVTLFSVALIANCASLVGADFDRSGATDSTSDATIDDHPSSDEDGGGRVKRR